MIGAIGLVQFNTFINLPMKGQWIMKMDKSQVPLLRIRTRPIKNRTTTYTEGDWIADTKEKLLHYSRNENMYGNREIVQVLVVYDT